MREVEVPRKGALAALFAVLLTVPVPTSGQDSPAVPRVALATTEIDAGTVVRGKLVEAVFELRNEGTADLRILSAKPG
jgi:hypothetical protein